MATEQPRDLEVIDGIRREHAAAVERGDVEWLAAAFAEDGVQMPPNAPANLGRPAIRSWFQGLFGAFDTGFSLSADEVHVAGEWAFERGAYSIVLTPRGGEEPMRQAGKYITIYARRPGGWVIARDIWNDDAPPPGLA